MQIVCLIEGITIVSNIIHVHWPSLWSGNEKWQRMKLFWEAFSTQSSSSRDFILDREQTIECSIEILISKSNDLHVFVYYLILVLTSAGILHHRIQSIFCTRGKIRQKPLCTPWLAGLHGFKRSKTQKSLFLEFLLLFGITRFAVTVCFLSCKTQIGISNVKHLISAFF